MILNHLKSFPFYFLPHHFLTRIIYKLTRIESPHVTKAIEKFIAKFNVNIDEAKHSDISHYNTFNEFFTRELADGVRTIDKDTTNLCSPVDGTVSQAGPIKSDAIFQAKGHEYSATELLGGDKELASLFKDGEFLTIYLSPRDYHRIHMPLSGQLTHQIHVPGRLFSVAPFTVETVPRVFARNERVVCLFDTEFGKMAMVLVGAMNVAAIETVWDGLVTPPAGKTINTKRYDKISLDKGDEMGRFNMGSTVIILHNNKNWQWSEHINPEQPLQLGECITKL